jgi:hypothetical protein
MKTKIKFFQAPGRCVVALNDLEFRGDVQRCQLNQQGSPSFTCQLQRAPSLTGPWNTSAAQTADTNGLIQFHDLFPPADRAFYRTVQQ